LFGVGPVLAARFLGEVGDIGRFPSKHHFAAHTGTAPLEASSGQVVRHRLSRAGDRKLNHALYMMAMVQVRRPSAGQAYYRRKLAEGKSPKKALRCLKRRLSDAVYRCLLADQHDQRSGAVRSGSHKGPLDGDLEPAGASPRPTVATRDLLPSRPGSVLSKIMGFEGQRIDVGEEDARPVAATDRQDRAIRLGGA
jgi:transposase